MKRFLLALLAALTLAAICTQPAYAYDIASEQAEAFGTAALESALPAQTYDAFGTLTVADAAHPRPLLQKLWGYVLHEGGGALASAARNAALLLAVVFLAALCASLSASGACAKVTQMTGAVAVAALSVTHVTSCITAGSSALTTLRDFSKILLPSMCAAAAASGAATSAAAKYAATSLFLDVLLSAETAVLLPMLYTYAGTVICGAALEQDVRPAAQGASAAAHRLCRGVHALSVADGHSHRLSGCGCGQGRQNRCFRGTAGRGQHCGGRCGDRHGKRCDFARRHRHHRRFERCRRVRHAVFAAGRALCFV